MDLSGELEFERLSDIEHQCLLQYLGWILSSLNWYLRHLTEVLVPSKRAVLWPSKIWSFDLAWLLFLKLEAHLMMVSVFMKKLGSCDKLNVLLRFELNEMRFGWEREKRLEKEPKVHRLAEKRQLVS